MDDLLKQAVGMFPTKSAFCAAIDMKPQFWRQIETGARPLPMRFALPIQRATKGAVPCHRLFPEHFPDPHA